MHISGVSTSPELDTDKDQIFNSNCVMYRTFGESEEKMFKCNTKANILICSLKVELKCWLLMVENYLSWVSVCKKTHEKSNYWTYIKNFKSWKLFQNKEN